MRLLVGISHSHLLHRYIKMLTIFLLFLFVHCNCNFCVSNFLLIGYTFHSYCLKKQNVSA